MLKYTPSKDPLWKKYWRVNPKEPYPHLKGSAREQLVVYRTSQNGDPGFDKWIKKIQAAIKTAAGYSPGDEEKIQIVSVCWDCESSLLLLTGKGIRLYVTTEAARRGSDSTAGSLSGESDGIYYSSNMKLRLPEWTNKEESKKGKIPYKPLDPNVRSEVVNVAVFDTGLARGELSTFLINNNHPTPCIPQAWQGWNFTTPDRIFEDDHSLRHGSNVARFIYDQVIREGGNPVRLIVVKIHSNKGMCDLYSVLCGLAYARHRGAHIINASFGYYVPIDAPDSAKKGLYAVNLFKTFIKEQLLDHKILLVAAAGNESSRGEIKRHFKGLYPVPQDPRDLDQIHFYPASFARTMENVIAVTTVDPGVKEVSPRQNFSNNVVDIGVPSDNDDFSFDSPRISNLVISGSSYATPIVTGLIAGNYSRYVGNTDKAQIIQALSTMNKLTVAPDLTDSIKGGIVMRR